MLFLSAGQHWWPQQEHHLTPSRHDW